MLQNAYFLAKIGADTAENEQHFAEILPTDALCRLLPGDVEADRAPSLSSFAATAEVAVAGGATGRSPPERRRRGARRTKFVLTPSSQNGFCSNFF